MAVMHVALGERSYPIMIEPGIVGQIGAWLSEQGFRRVHVISQAAIWQAHGEAVVAGLQAANLWPGDSGYSLVPDGEVAKSWNVAGALYDDLLANGLDRHDVIIALGGGVVGDLAGFVAATYLRGIAFVQVPTSLLAQVDASVGGKVGLNHRVGKNLIGAFHQPTAVFSDPLVLQTLPPAELRAGLAECIKHGVIADAAYLTFIETNLDRLLQCEPEALVELVAGSCQIKAAVVASDEREAGRRAILNYGHTAAHALEAVLDYTWRHGEAVAAGMIVAAELSAQLGLCQRDLPGQLAATVRRCGLPNTLPPVSSAALLAAMQRDKKRAHGQQTWVLVQEPGTVVLRRDVPEELVTEVLTRLGATA